MLLHQMIYVLITFMVYMVYLVKVQYSQFLLFDILLLASDNTRGKLAQISRTLATTDTVTYANWMALYFLSLFLCDIGHC